MNETSVQMPQYKCHKIVGALKIVATNINPDGSLDLFFKLSQFVPINLESVVATRFRILSPEDLGYYVVYEDGYVSWSPTKAFEDGYTEIPF